MLLHGWGASLDWWDNVTARLAPHHRVLRVDLRGHGCSPDSPQGYDLAIAGRELAGLLAGETSEAVTVVGQSMGGMIAVELAVAAPALVERLVLIDAPPALRYRRLPLLGRLTLLPLLGPVLRATAPRPLLRRNLRFLFAETHAVPDAAVTAIRGLSWHSYAGWNRAIERYLRDRPTLVEKLHGLGKPTLVLWGAEDRFWVPAALDEFAAVPTVETVLVQGAGHSVHIEAPADTARHIARFAGRRGTSAATSEFESRPLR